MMEMVLAVVMFASSNGPSPHPLGRKWGQILTGRHMMITLAIPCHCHRMAKSWLSGHFGMMEMVIAVVMFASSNGIMIKDSLLLISHDKNWQS